MAKELLKVVNDLQISRIVFFNVSVFSCAKAK